MKLSTRARYGLRICFLLALNEGNMPLSQLVKQTNLSQKYLEQILGMLKKASLISTKRGVSGGYELTKTPDKISVNEILTALKDNFEITDCVKGECDDEYCPNRRFILRLYNQIDDILTNTTLKSMLDDVSCFNKQNPIQGNDD